MPFEDKSLVLLAPLSGEIELIKAGEDIVVTGSLSTVLELSCTRCLTPVRVPATIELEEHLPP